MVDSLWADLSNLWSQFADLHPRTEVNPAGLSVLVLSSVVGMSVRGDLVKLTEREAVF